MCILTLLKALDKCKATHIRKWGHRYRRKSVNYTFFASPSPASFHWAMRWAVGGGGCYGGRMHYPVSRHAAQLKDVTGLNPASPGISTALPFVRHGFCAIFFSSRCSPSVHCAKKASESYTNMLKFLWIYYNLQKIHSTWCGNVVALLDRHFF